MSLLRRLTTTVSAKANSLLDRYDDPAAMLDYDYELLVEQVAKARAVVAHIGSAQQQLTLESQRLGDCVQDLAARAGRFAGEGRVDLAREALARRRVLMMGISSLEAQGAELAREEERFTEASGRLEDAVEVLGVERDSIKVGYALTGSRDQIDVAISGARRDLDSVRRAVQRAEARYAELRQRTASIEALLDSGSVLDFTSSPADIARELREERESVDLETDLDALRGPRR